MWVEKHRKIWRIRDLVDGKQVTVSPVGGYDTKTAAKDAMSTMRAEQITGTGVVPRGGERLMGDFLTEWWGDQESTYEKVRSKSSIEGVMERYIRRMLGSLTLDQITAVIVQRWVNDLTAGRTKVRSPRPLAAKTVRNAHGLLHQILDAAVLKYKLIRHNPCELTKLPEDYGAEMRFLTHAEAERLVMAIPEHYRPLIVFLLGTGVRWAEALGLRVKNVDVLARKVTILKQTTELAGRFHDEDPKSKRGRRTLTLPATALDAVIPLVVLDGVQDDRERRIFLGPRGGMIRREKFYKIWHTATAAAGVEGLRIHDLRHTHISWLISAGVPLTAISRRAGHASIAITSDRYGHLLDEVDERLVDAAEKALSLIDLGGKVGRDEPRQAPVSPRQAPSDPSSAGVTSL